MRMNNPPCIWFFQRRYLRFVIIKHVPRVVIIALMIFLIALTCIRYRADTHFNDAMRHKHFGRIDAHLVSIKKAVALNPFVLNYTNVMALTYMQMAMKSLKEGADRQETSKHFVNAMLTAEKVQRRYPGEYWSARMLLESYVVLNQLSKRDLFDYIEKYNNIVISARPYSEGVK